MTDKHRYGNCGDEFLVEQSRSRKRPKVGDIFVLKTKHGDFYWARLISKSAGPKILNEFKDYIIYLYNVATKNTNEVPLLAKNNLLIPPFFFGSTFWTTGYGVTIENRPLKEEDVLAQHYFKTFINDTYEDGFGNIISPPNDGVPKAHIGSLGMPSLGSIDEQMRNALKTNIT